MDERQAMQRAIRIAGSAMPHPNPRVGAVVLDASGTVLGSGFHAAAGDDHAEVVALREAGARAAGGTLVVTLEPCVHVGRTPPCTEAILDAGIRRVVVGALDPDRRVAGAGVHRLAGAGVEVVVAADPSAAEAVDPGYFHHRRTGRPRVTLKIAATLDGQVAAADGTSQWITSSEARLDGHRLRAASDAVMVGAGTLRLDDPALTVRIPGFDGRQPRPVVVAGGRPLPTHASIWMRDPVVLSPSPAEVPGRVVVVPGERGVDLRAGLGALGELGIVDLLVEGGPRLAAALLDEDLVDRGVLYLGARLAGGVGRAMFEARLATIADARGVAIVAVERIGRDIRIEFTLEEH